jgi:tetratricopeptide (TPR) repeat protein
MGLRKGVDSRRAGGKPARALAGDNASGLDDIGPIIRGMRLRASLKTLPPLILGMAVYASASWTAAAAGTATARTAATPSTVALPPLDPAERLGTVSFPVSCAPAVQARFNRGVALLHDFWYDEAQPQFEAILAADPACAMAHWGVAMSIFHQIWDRPDEATLKSGWAQLEAAQAHPAKTARERAYVAALREFYRPDQADYQARAERYAGAMALLYRDHPEDVDAGAFYALSLLAATSPDDESLAHERKAMAVLRPLFAKFPDNPGVVHYVIHACDTPSLAAEALPAANHYGGIAASGPHAVHMPGHIFSRLGMWQADIDSQVASVAASHAAEAHHMSGSMDQFHSYDFLLYAYLQSGQDGHAKAVLDAAGSALDRFDAMPNMGDHYMVGMFPYYRTKYPVFYRLEMRDWQAAAALEPIKAAPADTQLLTYWARTIADGHLGRAPQAHADLAGYDALMDEVRKGPHAYYAGSVGGRIRRAEMLGWVAFADGDTAGAVKHLRQAADLQDEVGQGEVDIPAREMLADVLLDAQQPREALAEYRRSLQLSPNRFNGLFNAGRAAETAGDKQQASDYYAALLKSTGDGADSARAELTHAKTFLASTRLAAQ